MKKLIILFLFVIPLSVVHGQDKSFQKLSESKGITVVHISKSMLSMMGDIKTQGVDIGSISGKLSSISVFTSDNASGSKIIRDELGNILKEGKYEQTIYVKDNSSSTVFYNRKIKSKNGSETEILMVVEDKEVVLIRLIGDINENDLKQLTNGRKSNVSMNRINSTGQLVDLKKSLKDVESELNKMIKDLNSEYDKTKAELNRYEILLKDGRGGEISWGEAGSFQGRIGNTQGRIGRLQGKIGGIQGRLSGLQASLHPDHDELEELQAFAARLQERAAGMQIKFGELQAEAGRIFNSSSFKEHNKAEKEAVNARANAAKQRENEVIARENNSKEREKALKQAQKDREKASKEREKALKQAEKQRQEALKKIEKIREEAEKNHKIKTVDNFLKSYSSKYWITRKMINFASSKQTVCKVLK